MRRVTAYAGARRPTRGYGGGLLRNGDPIPEFLKPVLDDDHAYEGVSVAHLPRYTRFLVDLTHATFTDLDGDLVGAERGAEVERHGCYRDGAGKRAILSPPPTPPTHISSPT